MVGKGTSNSSSWDLKGISFPFLTGTLICYEVDMCRERGWRKMLLFLIHYYSGFYFS